MKKISFTIAVFLLMLNCYGLDVVSKAFADPTDTLDTSYIAVTEMTEEEKAEFFQKAFGKPIPMTFYPHDMIVILDRNSSVHMEVYINPYTHEVHFSRTTLLPFLEEFLLVEGLKELLGADVPETIDEEFLQLHGFQLTVDMKQQTITLSSPIELREKTIITMRKTTPLNILQPDGTQQISGYVNMTHSVNLMEQHNRYYSKYNLNLNIQDWLVQSDVLYNTMLPDKKANLTGLRLVTDWTEYQSRIILGDTNSPNARISMQKKPLASAFQQGLVGVDVSHAVSMTSVNNRPNDFGYMFLVQEDVRLDVEINGKNVYTEILFPGKYEIQRLPFVHGKNEITIRLTGIHGVIEERKIEYFYNPTLLAKGQKEYKFASGFPHQNGPMSEIDSSRYTNLAYWRQAITDQIGATAYVQTVRGNVLLGSMAEYGFGNTIGFAEIAHSRNALGSSGNAMRLQMYSSNSSSFIQKRNWKPNYYTINFLYNSPYFDPILAKDAGVFNNTRSIVSSSLVWQLSPASQIQFAASVRDKRDMDDATAFTIRTYYRSSRWLYTASLQKSTGSEEEMKFFTMATWRPKGSPRNRFTYRYDNTNQEHSVSANIWSESFASLNYFVNSSIVDSQHHSQSIMVQKQDFGYTLMSNVSRTTSGDYHNDEYRVNYNGMRGLMNVEHNRMSLPDNHTGTTSMMLNTSVAFVGTHWGISRPISRSFAIFYPNNDGLKDSKIRFTNGSLLDRYSVAVYPTLNNYQLAEVSIDWQNTRDVPLGVELGGQKYVLQGRFNSGQAIPIGKPGGVIMASVTLLKPNGDVLDLDVGTFTHVNHPDVSIQFFTNRTGKVYVMGLMPGEYDINIIGNPYETYTITIPKNAESPFDLGTITLRKRMP